MPELILLIRVAEDEARGELRASTVRKPRAAPGAHVAHSASTGASVFNVCPAGDDSDPVMRDARFLIENAQRDTVRGERVAL